MRRRYSWKMVEREVRLGSDSRRSRLPIAISLFHSGESGVVECQNQSRVARSREMRRIRAGQAREDCGAAAGVPDPAPTREYSAGDEAETIRFGTRLAARREVADCLIFSSDMSGMGRGAARQKALSVATRLHTVISRILRSKDTDQLSM
jgi:hypothetical protein